ncbi:ABC transporter substrate-binding protein, partial [Patescibacteria group bacterium]
ISQTISRGLIAFDETGQVKPDLAKTWEILEEETLYKIYLKPDVFWNDGTRLIASDLNYDIPDVEVRYPTENIIEFKLEESYSPFLSILARPVFNNNQLGAGDFTIKKIKYRGPFLKSLELVGSNKTLIYQFYPSNQSAWLGFRLGEVNTLKNLITNPLSEAWQKKLDINESTNYQQYIAIIFNLSHPQLAAKPLRQALAYAIKDKSPSPETRALSPISPKSWAYNSKVKPYNFSPSQAKDLFEKAGEEASISGQLEINLGTSPSLLNLAESIAQSWEETLNIKTNVKTINSIDQNFEAILVVQEIPLDPDQHALWHSTQDTNISKYSDLKVDKLLEDGRKILDQDQRAETYQDFQRFLVEDSPAIFLQHPITYTINR